MAASRRLLPPGESIDAALMSMEFSVSRAIIPGLLYVGLTILASRSKDGKSFMSIKLGLCLALGVSFLGLPPVQCGVLVLALEDTLDRIKDRLAALPYDKTNRLHFATSSDGLPGALFNELDSQLAAFPDIRVVVIDTLQKVRHRAGDVGYNAGYEDLGLMKEYADEHGIAILLLHHTRKAEVGTEYDRISGTSGITGVADTMMVLSHAGEETKLLVKGREFEEREYDLVFNGGNWELANEETVRERAVRTLLVAVKRVPTSWGPATPGAVPARSSWRPSAFPISPSALCRSSSATTRTPSAQSASLSRGGGPTVGLSSPWEGRTTQQAVTEWRSRPSPVRLRTVTPSPEGEADECVGQPPPHAAQTRRGSERPPTGR